MAVEIELKAHIDDYASLKERLSVVGVFCRSYKKCDSYWLPSQPDATGVRVRRESGISTDGAAHESVLATYKIKKISGGIEVNHECEFSVSDADLFEELLGRLGLRSAVRKEKEGWAWTVRSQIEGQPPILAELSMVKSLGWFLEIEILAADNNEKTVEESRGRLFALLEKLEIPTDKIEERPYTAMLAGVLT
jgi:predicted adenylyl cyclase CyaB